MKIRGITVPKTISIQEDKVKAVIATPILNRDYDSVEGELDQHLMYVIVGKADRATLDRINIENKVWVEFDDGTAEHALMEISARRDIGDPDFTAGNLIQFTATLLVTQGVFHHPVFNPVVFA
jgi:hypothetical protein